MNRRYPAASAAARKGRLQGGTFDFDGISRLQEIDVVCGGICGLIDKELNAFLDCVGLVLNLLGRVLQREVEFKAC